jgi:glycosyltransferase involved in cell wall biosynthesis
MSEVQTPIAPLPLLSIVIPCRNEVKSITACIEAVLNNDWPQIAMEILVVDGMSDDGTRERLEELRQIYPQLKLIDNPQQLTPIAFNLGIEHAQGDLIQIVGARQILARNYLRICYSILERAPEIGCVGGKVLHISTSNQSRAIACAMTSPFGVGPGNWRALNQEKNVDTASTPMYRKSIFSEIGLFDPELVRNQDDEFNFRVRQAGYSIVFTPSTTVDYFVRGNFRQLFKQYFQYGYWKTYVNRKHKTVTTMRQVIPALFIAFILIGASCSLFWPIMAWPYGLIWLLYLTLGIYSARQANSWQEGLQIIFALFILHSAYGLGYIEGIWHFYLLKRNPAKTHASLSR